MISRYGLSLQQWMSIIEDAPQLEVIKTHSYPQLEDDGIAKLMATKTNLKKIVLMTINEEECNVLKNRIDPEWQIEGTAQPQVFVDEVTFIRREK